MNSFIRKAEEKDFGRIAEIEIFNYRLNFYPIFKNDEFYFRELSVLSMTKEYLKDKTVLQELYVYDDGAVKGFVRIVGKEIKKLFVEPILQGNKIGEALLLFALQEKQADTLWALEKNSRALKFYERHGFYKTGNRKPEEDTDEFLIEMKAGK